MATYHIVETVRGSSTEVLHVCLVKVLTTELHLQLMIVNVLPTCFISSLSLPLLLSCNFVLKDELVNLIFTAFLTGKSITQFCVSLVYVTSLSHSKSQVIEVFLRLELSDLKCFM